MNNKIQNLCYHCVLFMIQNKLRSFNENSNNETKVILIKLHIVIRHHKQEHHKSKELVI